MSYALNVEPKGSFLHITVTGENSYENVARYLSEAQDVCRKYQCFNVLIEENLAGPSLDTVTIYDLASQGSEKIRGEGFKIAFVDVNPEHDASAMKFAENVAVNRAVFVRMFSTIHEAEQWLMSGEG